MAYSVQHVRVTLECDACGLVEKRDVDAGDSDIPEGWDTVHMQSTLTSLFCCPTCSDAVFGVLTKRDYCLKGKLEQAVDLLSRSAPLTWAATGNLDSATEWEKAVHEFFIALAATSESESSK